VIIKKSELQRVIMQKTSDNKFWGSVLIHIKEGKEYSVEIIEKIKIKEDYNSIAK